MLVTQSGLAGSDAGICAHECSSKCRPSDRNKIEFELLEVADDFNT